MLLSPLLVFICLRGKLVQELLNHGFRAYLLVLKLPLGLFDFFFRQIQLLPDTFNLCLHLSHLRIALPTLVCNLILALFLLLVDLSLTVAFNLRNLLLKFCFSPSKDFLVFISDLLESL